MLYIYTYRILTRMLEWWDAAEPLVSYLENEGQCFLSIISQIRI